jgi:dTDP-4-dehydrorhamnose 3,5-epimerase
LPQRSDGGPGMSALTVHKTALDGVLLLEAPTNFHDFRGEYVEIYNRQMYREAGITVDFIQDDISVSTHKVLRGLHGDGETAKLVSCLYGKFYLVVVNNDPDSHQYRQWTSFTLSDKNRQQVFIPPKFANGHLVMSDWTIFHYKQNTKYNRTGQFTLLWNDPELGLWWPVDDPIVSRRDAGLD